MHRKNEVGMNRTLKLFQEGISANGSGPYLGADKVILGLREKPPTFGSSAGAQIR